jgi:ribonuclease HI
MAKVAPFPRFDWVLRFDGGSRGNPGEAGCGAVIYASQKATLKEVWCGYFYMGKHLTNNQAEYGGLIEGLKQCITMKLKSIEIQGDSQLIIRQVQGTYACRNEKLKPLYEKVHKLLAKLSLISFKHIARSENDRADELANLAMDKEASFSYYTNFTEYEALLKSIVDEEPLPVVKKTRAKKVVTTVEGASSSGEASEASSSAEAGAPVKAARKPRAKKVSTVETASTTAAGAEAAVVEGMVAESAKMEPEGEVKVRKPRATRAKKEKDAVVTAESVSSGTAR